MATDEALSDNSLILSKEAATKFKAHGKQLTEFIRQWNADPENRDKAYVVFQELLE